MKRFYLLFTFLAVISSTTLVAQDTDLNIEKPQTSADVANESVRQGNWLVGASVGSLGYNFKSETFLLVLEPRAGYFISDNAVLGAQAQLGLALYDGGENFSYGLTPFARYYFPEGASPNSRWFGEALAGFAGSSMKDSDGDRIFSSVLGLRAGYAHFVARNVALEATLNYTRTSADISVDTSTSGLSVGVGFQIYLPGRGNL
ncbi:hypothetical protein [Pontibacter ramchanderi]|uniref:Outer membrane protein with beta-barrel domain n=1 Tax=Pontibacter ramchanderi TaxID=1179743 RepID=A0A2N3V1D4_9BACT|nr:hypothetical protein [Pontibacter ramchanderi]PKV75425.1 hypothetical protein BD749_0367 [Pontibacter ramchanderi]